MYNSSVYCATVALDVGVSSRQSPYKQSDVSVALGDPP